MRFDTRDKKPKVYGVAWITAAVAVVFALLSRCAPSVRLQWANVTLAVYFGLVIAILVRAFFRQLQYNPYSYNTIIYTGFALFCLFLLGVHIYGAVMSFRDADSFSEQQMVTALVDSAKNYMQLTAPFLVVFAGALFVSNVSLIRHEGRRFVNILGMILGFLLVAGELVILLLNRWLAGAGRTEVWLHVLVNLSSALYLYFECMLIGAIAADLIAALYEPQKDKDYLIVLGCGIRKDGTPTPLLRGRLELALGFAREQVEKTGKEPVFVCSGGQGPDEVRPEADAMGDYLLARGVSADRIIREDRSCDTAENMRFSGEKIPAGDPAVKIAFFTTNYHVFRAGLKARRVKMRAVGMGAPTKWYFWPNASVREFVGLLTEHRGKQGLIMAGLLVTYGVLTVLAFR